MPVPNRVHSADSYPPWIGLIFLFNLIVGTGALTLPKIFAKAGWILGIIVIAILAFISYMTVTFVMEAMACAHAVLHWRRMQFLKKEAPNDDADSDAADGLLSRQTSESSMEQTPLCSHRSMYYVLDKKIELGEMAGLFFSDLGRILFYLCITIYLYGDLSIYSAAVAKSLRDVLCDTCNETATETDDDFDSSPCWKTHTLSRIDIYRLSLIAFGMLLGPFVLSNVQKTKYIQMVTVIFRCLAFTIMISLAISRLITNGPEGHPPTASVLGLPSLFGACVYSFMCHHSLPSLIAPIRNKQSLKSLMSFDYGLICSFYILLAVTGAFAFSNLDDLYTLNFVPNDSQETSVMLKVFEYFLALFPVLTLSASFPIIAITLRNNLQTLFLDMSRLESYNYFQRRLLFPLMAILPPLLVTYFTENLTSLVGFTGSYAGTGIQYLIPVALVYYARKTCADLLGQGIVNQYRSPFRDPMWLVFVLVWSFACVALVTVNFFTGSP